MSDLEFNLLYEPWIMVMKSDASRDELSILEVFERAHEYERLSGELPTQDVAILRLLLAVLHVVFARFDCDGTFLPLASQQQADKRWKTLKGLGQFPVSVIDRYLTDHEDRFWLFHPQWPFYQIADIGKATEYTAAKLNGELSESSNKSKLFSQRSGEKKYSLSFAEAARWLLHVNGFDDTSAKPKSKGLPSPGAGWLGKLGLVFAHGNNLFETLLLNMFLLENPYCPWAIERPVWEVEPNARERVEIVQPDNLSELYTLQSRRLKLIRAGDQVTGYSLLGGDFFKPQDAFIEPMTVWRSTGEKASAAGYLPRRHNPSRQLWREFPTLLVQSEQGKRAGIIRWAEYLQGRTLINDTHFRFETTGVKYGDKDFFVEDVFCDQITFSSALLDAIGEAWVNRIVGELEFTDKLVDQIGYLAQNLAKAAGKSGGQRGINWRQDGDIAKSQAYFRLDLPFRSWLSGMDPRRDSLNEVCEVWWEQSRRIIRAFGDELVRLAGIPALIGHWTDDKHVFASPKDHNYFLFRTSSREALLHGGKKNG